MDNSHPEKIAEEKPKIFVMKEETRLMIIHFLKNRHNLQAIQKLNNLPELIKYLESVDKEELKEIYEKADVELKMTYSHTLKGRVS